MATNLDLRPEEIFSWLNEFEPTYLSPTSQQYIHSIDDRIDAALYPDACDLIDDLQEITRLHHELYERAEVYFESGFAYYRMGYRNLAIDALKHAILEFPSGRGNNHQQVVARCILGAILWEDECDQNQAIIEWKRCVKEFAELRLQADRENKQTKAEWYADQHFRLQAVLTARTAERLGRGDRPNRGAPRRPGPRSDRYQELVGLLHGDHATADRLIALEQRNAPDCDRAEWIDRAIDKLLRDRR